MLGIKKIKNIFFIRFLIEEQYLTHVYYIIEAGGPEERKSRFRTSAARLLKSLHTTPNHHHH